MSEQARAGTLPSIRQHRLAEGFRRKKHRQRHTKIHKGYELPDYSLHNPAGREAQLCKALAKRAKTAGRNHTRHDQ